MSCGSGSRASVLNVEDVIIMIDSDTRNNNNSTPTQPPPHIVIGEPAEGYNIHQSMIITHNYYGKVLVGDGETRAKCLMCLQDMKKELLLKMSDGNLRGIEGHMQSFHKLHYEKYLQQKKEVAELREKNRFKRGSQKSDFGYNLKQQKLELAGVNKMVQLKEDPHLQARYDDDEARVLFSARTFTPFHALKQDLIYARAFLPNSYTKIKNKSVKTMSRHTDLKADQVRRDIMSIILSVLDEKKSKTFGFSTDLYSSPSLFSIIALTIHFTDREFNQRKFVLYAEYFGTRRHTGENIQFALNTMFKESGLDGADVSRYILMDNASNNKRCATLFDGEHTVIWCYIHSLQLAIKDTFKIKVGHIRVT